MKNIDIINNENKFENQGSHNFDVMAVPNDRAFFMTLEQSKQIQDNNRQMIHENSQTFIQNNLSDPNSGPVLKKRK